MAMKVEDLIRALHKLPHDMKVSCPEVEGATQIPSPGQFQAALEDIADGPSSQGQGGTQP